VKSTMCSQTVLNALAPGLHSGQHWVAYRIDSCYNLFESTRWAK